MKKLIPIFTSFCIFASFSPIYGQYGKEERAAIIEDQSGITTEVRYLTILDSDNRYYRAQNKIAVFADVPHLVL